MDNSPEAKGVTVRGAESISLDQLVSATSTSVLRALREYDRQDKDLLVNPRIWVGIWIDLERFRRGLPGMPGSQSGPGGPGSGGA